MRVLYLTMNPNRTSTTVPTEGWLKCLRPAGLEPVLVTSKRGPFSKWAEDEGVPTYEIPLRAPSKRNPLPFLSSLLRLRSVVRHHGIELIHCNEQDIYPIGQYLARLCRRPVVVSVHFRMQPDFCRWAFGPGKCPDRMFFVSHTCQEDCQAGLTSLVPEEDQFVLHNGLDMQHYTYAAAPEGEFRQAHGLTSEDRLIGVGCALRPRKQLDHLFEAAARLENSCVKVLLAGGPVAGDEAYAERLLQEGKQRLGTRLIHVGKLSDIRAFCRSLDAFVNTSLEESFGIAALEALAGGTPVVGYPSHAVSEVVLPDGGEIVAQDDVAGLVAALDRWFADAENLQTRRAKARRQAERFSIATISQGLWSHYEQVLAIRNRSRADR